MTTPFRQLILPGDVGSDVLAVKRAVRAMGVKGAGRLIVNGKGRKRAGPAFVDVIGTVQRQHREQTDGKYGKQTHAIVAPHFDAWDVVLYRAAKIRDRIPPPLPVTSVSAMEAAKQLLTFRAAGKYHADNPGDLADIQRTANGQPVWSRRGYWVHIDPRPLRLLVWLIECGYRVGTFALCSDHHDDGPHGHAGGLAVDISSIDGHSIGGAGAHAATLALGHAVHFDAPPSLRPAQLICAGSGGAYYSDIEALCIPYASFYGWSTLSGHRDHLHCGFF